MHDTRNQMNEVGSSVALSTPHPNLSSQPESQRKPRSHPDPVSSHILDTSVGLPAKGVSVSMYRMGGEQAWTKLQSRSIHYTLRRHSTLMQRLYLRSRTLKHIT